MMLITQITAPQASFNGCIFLFLLWLAARGATDDHYLRQ